MVSEGQQINGDIVSEIAKAVWRAENPQEDPAKTPVFGSD